MSLLSALGGIAPQGITPNQDAGLPPPPRMAGGYSPSLGGDFSHGAKPDAAYAALPPLFHPAYQIFPDSSPADAISQYNAAYGPRGNSQAPPVAPGGGGGAPLNNGAAGVFSNSALNQALSGGQP
jgi:hypothetical protein